MKHWTLAAAVVAGLWAPGPGVAAAEARLATLATGAIAGVYYPVGVALCRLVNQHRQETGLRCAAMLAEGSVGNIEALRAGQRDFALVQSDTQRAALEGAGGFAAEGPFGDLRSVMSLHTEALTLVTRRDAGIAGPADLAGHPVSLGAAGTGSRSLAVAVLQAFGLAAADFAGTPELSPGAQAAALCQGEIDAFFYAVGHPAPAIQDAARGCDVAILPLTGPAVEALVAADPSLNLATVPGGLYRGNPSPIPTFGVAATLVTRADVPDDVVRPLVAGIYGDFGTLTGLQPALAGLQAPATATDALSAPLHPAAEAFFREKGWLAGTN